MLTLNNENTHIFSKSITILYSYTIYSMFQINWTLALSSQPLWFEWFDNNIDIRKKNIKLNNVTKGNVPKTEFSINNTL